MAPLLHPPPNCKWYPAGGSSYQIPLALGLSLLVVPGLVAEGCTLPHILEHRVDERLADEDAQVHNEEHVHGPATRGRGRTAPVPGHQEPTVPSSLSQEGYAYSTCTSCCGRKADTHPRVSMCKCTHRLQGTGPRGWSPCEGWQGPQVSGPLTTSGQPESHQLQGGTAAMQRRCPQQEEASLGSGLPNTGLGSGLPDFGLD